MFYGTYCSMNFLIVLVCHLTSDQNMEETRKNSLPPTMTKRTTSGESNRIGTRAEDIFTVTKNSSVVDE
jgi:hypothetical protein